MSENETHDANKLTRGGDFERYQPVHNAYRDLGFAPGKSRWRGLRLVLAEAHRAR